MMRCGEDADDISEEVTTCTSRSTGSYEGGCEGSQGIRRGRRGGAVELCVLRRLRVGVGGLGLLL